MIASTLPKPRKDLPNARRGKRLTREPKRSDGLAIPTTVSIGADCKALNAIKEMTCGGVVVRSWTLGAHQLPDVRPSRLLVT